MIRSAFLLLFVLLFSGLVSAQQTTFTPVCAGTDDTSRFTSIISTIGANTGTIRLPYKNGTRCAVNTLTIPSNVALDNGDGTGIKVNAGQVLTVVGPVVNPVGKPMFFGPGSTVFTGNTFIGTNGQALTSNGTGGTSWTTITGGGGGGAVDTVFGRAGDVVAVTNDYTWAQINKAGSSLADLTFRSADDLSNGTTGTGLVVLRDSPSLITPVLGAATATSINGLSIATTSGASLSIATSKSLTVSNTLTLAAASDGLTGSIPATGGFAMGAATLSVSSLTDASTTNHSHAITTNSNPGAAAALLASNASGHLQLLRLGIGIAPTQPLEVNGNVLISAATANLYLRDTLTGFQAASSGVVTPQNNNAFRSTDYTSGLVGWNISALGNAEFNNVDVRGAIHASIFTYNAIAATAGTLGVFKSAAKLRSDVVIPSGPTYGTTTVNIDVVDAEGLTHAASQLFATNHILRLKDGLVGDTWLKVASASDQTTFWRYTATIMAGTNTVTYRAGLGVPSYGLSGDGFIVQTADQTNSPYLQMATHDATFTTSDVNGTLVTVPQLRIGNLNGSFGYGTNVFGFGSGTYGVAGKSWITVDPAGGVRIGNNTTSRILLAADGSGHVANSLISWDTAGNLNVTGNATIAGWTVNPASISSGTTYLASNFNIPATVSTWFGKGAAGYSGWNMRDSSNRGIQALLGNGAIYPYVIVEDTTRVRIALGGLNNAWGSDGSTDSMGMKVWSSAGTKLVEFSDAQNAISGWTIGAAKISSTGIDINSGASAGLAFGTTPPTSASVGTGIWLDRTGLYGLLSSVVQAKVDATSGAITGGAGTVVLDATGLAITSGVAEINGVRWNASGATRAQVRHNYVGGGVSQMTIQSVADGGTDGEIILNPVSDDANSGVKFRIKSAEGGSGSVNFYSDSSEVFGGVALGTISAPRTMLDVIGTAIIGNSGGSVTASTTLELRSTTGAFLPPRMTTAQKNALTAVDGMVLYDSDLAKLQVRAGGAWVSLH